MPFQLNCLHSVQNIFAHLVFSHHWNNPAMPATPLRKLHWCWVPEYIRFKQCLLTYQVLNNLSTHFTPSHLQIYFKWVIPDSDSAAKINNSFHLIPKLSCSVTEQFLMVIHCYGIHCTLSDCHCSLIAMHAA